MLNNVGDKGQPF